MKTEKRMGLPVETRADDEGVRVAGYAAVFNEATNIAGAFMERIEPGAFRDAVGRDDVVFLVNHDGLPLARSRAGQGTLTLREDERGLYMETVLDGEDPDVRAITGKMKRGDLDKMSFAFRAEVEEWDESGDLPVRTIKQARLYDVSVVTSPAYEGTEIGLRSLEAARAERINPELNKARRTRLMLALRGKE